MYDLIQKKAMMKPASSQPKSPHRCSCGKPISEGGECAECRKKREGYLSAATGFFGHDFSKISVHPVEQKAAMLSDSGKGIQQADNEDVIKMADTGGKTPPKVVPAAPAAPAAADCKYTISYNNITKPGCAAGKCGAQIIYDVTNVKAEGKGCPDSLNGLKVTESVTTDNGCTPGPVETGDGCPMDAHGNIANCTDTYAFCTKPAAFPDAGCTEVYTQKLFVDGKLAETRKITFRITKAKDGTCSGTVTRT